MECSWEFRYDSYIIYSIFKYYSHFVGLIVSFRVMRRVVSSSKITFLYFVFFGVLCFFVRYCVLIYMVRFLSVNSYIIFALCAASVSNWTLCIQEYIFVYIFNVYFVFYIAFALGANYYSELIENTNKNKQHL